MWYLNWLGLFLFCILNWLRIFDFLKILYSLNNLMSSVDTSQKFFRKKPVKELLPTQPVESVAIAPWSEVYAGYITDDDVKVDKFFNYP